METAIRGGGRTRQWQQAMPNRSRTTSKVPAEDLSNAKGGGIEKANSVFGLHLFI